MKDNSNFKSTLLLLAIALATSSQAYALDNTMGVGNQNAYTTAFKALDTDSDGTLSKSEAGKEKLFAKHFSVADKDSDGTLDQEEYTNYKTKAEQSNVKRVVKDSVITSRVKGSLLKEEGLKSM
jgi:hyperosmotically inducible periplasmic protein